MFSASEGLHVDQTDVRNVLNDDVLEVVGIVQLLQVFALPPAPHSSSDAELVV